MGSRKKCGKSSLETVKKQENKGITIQATAPNR